ncbi:hypothetical protein DERF_002688 [Dermatophagoides farinae]|uniref:Uncharacterized protein n=1 Tax=Dermatophagoides farinae TaxID=6954 RepID=A0A922LAV2_DERFA|nr:hypothetical protein DERF_002688 [Dermatophagoides farinae]
MESDLYTFKKSVRYTSRMLFDHQRGKRGEKLRERIYGCSNFKHLSLYCAMYLGNCQVFICRPALSTYFYATKYWRQTLLQLAIQLNCSRYGSKEYEHGVDILVECPEYRFLSIVALMMIVQLEFPWPKFICDMLNRVVLVWNINHRYSLLGGDCPDGNSSDRAGKKYRLSLSVASMVVVLDGDFDAVVSVIYLSIHYYSLMVLDFC